jgi:hypothetical protein
MTAERRTRQVDHDDNWMLDYHPSLGRPPIDPDAEERRDQRIGNWIVVLANGGAAALCLGAFYIGMLWHRGRQLEVFYD